jgi:hypothetical protein
MSNLIRSRKKTPPRKIIIYEADRVDIALNEYEFALLRESGRNHWKDVCLVSFSVGLACILNSVAEVSDQADFKITLPLFLNLLIGLVGLVLTIPFGIQWRKESQKLDRLAASVHDRPWFEALFEHPREGQRPESPTIGLKRIPARVLRKSTKSAQGVL